MTQEDILEMAREAGFEQLGPEIEDWICYTHQIERFASLVAAAEREACAKACEDFADGTSAYEVHHRFAAYKCADLIRKRGKNENIS